MPCPLTRRKLGILYRPDGHDSSGPVPQVHPGQECGHLVDLDRSDLEVQPRDGHGVSADTAAEVDHLTDPGLAEPLRMTSRDLQPVSYTHLTLPTILRVYRSVV